MATKLKNYSYHIVSKIAALILLGALIFTFIVSASFFVKYDDYIDEESYYHSNDFQMICIDIVDYSLRNQAEAVRLYAGNADYTAYDEQGALLTALSTVKRKPSDYRQDEIALIVTRDQQTGIFDYSIAPRSYLADVVIETPNRSIAITDDGTGPTIDKLLITFSVADNNDILSQNYAGFVNYNHWKHAMLASLFGSFIIGLLLAYYLIGTTGQSDSQAPTKLNWFDMIPGEVVILGDAMLLVLLVNMTKLPLDITRVKSIFNFTTLSTGYLIVVLSMALIMLFGFITILSLARSVKAKQFIKRFISLHLIFALLSLVGELFSIKNWRGPYSIKALFYLLAYGIVNFTLSFVIGNARSAKLSFISLVLLLAVNLFAVIWLKRQLDSLRQIVDFASDAVQNGTAQSVDSLKLTRPFQPFADDINAMNKGLSQAVDQAVKNERMRGELITNVTHDLKNPLTSIISYVDLLSREPLQNETAQQYVAVIAEKSNRLKELIDHLVEAAKANSGIAELNYQTVDLIALAKQLEGEYHVAMAEKELQFVIQTTLQAATVKTDISYYTRLLDNLFSNISKYAMPSTRVYCSIEADDGYRLCLKNISAEPLAISEDELMERFVRGDKARNTEGNGLGLSIAKSLALALDVGFTIQLDGDLFKVCLHHKSVEN